VAVDAVAAIRAYLDRDLVTASEIIGDTSKAM
jgi:hypothetical protein